MEEILNNIVSDFIIIDRGHLKYICKANPVKNHVYPFLPLFEIDMNTPEKETWVSWVIIWSVFEEKYKMNNQSIKDMIQDFFKAKLNYDIKVR